MEPRKDATRLPVGDELSHILDIEAKRPVAAGKDDVHYVDFAPIATLLTELGVSTELFYADIKDIHAVNVAGAALIGEAVAIITAKAPDSRRLKLLDAAYGYLAEDDEPKPSDLIFVFGSKTPARMEKAIKLYVADFSPKLLLSGDNPIYDAGNTAEANRYRQMGLQAGVPDDAMILDPKPITIADNVRSSLNLLDKLGVAPRSFILVNSPYSQRRGYATFKKYVSDSIIVYRCNSHTKPELSRQNWYKQADTASVVLNEYAKMRAGTVFNSN